MGDPMNSNEADPRTAPVADVGLRQRPRLLAAMEGCAFGIGQPVIVASHAISLVPAVAWPEIDRCLAEVVEGWACSAPASLPFPRQFALRLLGLAVAAARFAGLAVFDEGRILSVRKISEHERQLTLALPTVDGAAGECFGALLWAAQFLGMLLDGGNDSATKDLARSYHAKLVEKLAAKRAKGTNTLRFLNAAHAAGIPWGQVSSKCYQYGWGVHRLWSDSSMLETTPGIGIGLARDKMACAEVLRRGGLPVPDHFRAASLAQAKRLAERLGYPVVIKPSNLDGGIGVAAGLQNEEQLESAWAKARKHSKAILVEKHQEGEDYRLIVFDGQLVWAVGRQPAGVSGDGRSSIAELVAEANRDPRRGYHAAATLRPLSLDEEALALLTTQECSLETVLPVGRFVRLRRAANLSSGGTAVGLTADVHPDNRRLAEDAVRLIGLDLAGVDLIVPDLGVSWRESGGAIIEINAQPQLVAASQNHLYQAILSARISGNGRIPVVVVLGAGASAVAARLDRELLAMGIGAGLASRHPPRLRGEEVGRGGLSVFGAGRALLMNRRTEVLLLAVDHPEVLGTGLPVDRYDTLIVLDELSGDLDAARMKNVLSLILPHCAGEVVSAVPGVAAEMQRLGNPGGATFRQETSIDAMLAHAVRAIAEAGRADGKKDGAGA